VCRLWWGRDRHAGCNRQAYCASGNVRDDGVEFVARNWFRYARPVLRAIFPDRSVQPMFVVKVISSSAEPIFKTFETSEATLWAVDAAFAEFSGDVCGPRSTTHPHVASTTSRLAMLD
jgi:hypothetical protein